MSLALLPDWLARGSGCVVNVSSLGGRVPIANEAAYCASKYALCGWTEGMAVDLHGTGVEVKLVLPGSIDTEIWDQPGNEPAGYQGPFVPAADAAQSVIDAIEGDGFEYYAPPEMPTGGHVPRRRAEQGQRSGRVRRGDGGHGGRLVSWNESEDRLYFRQLLSGATSRATTRWRARWSTSCTWSATARPARRS